MSLAVTEDTPPDMLAGSMDLNVVLPNGKTVKMSVQRGTPMMDLLVQATTTHCMSPGDYSLQAMDDKGVLPFKPNTPIGALDTFTVKIVEKKAQGRGRAPQVPQSFLNTFRLQVHLPRSQLFVVRVTPDVTLYDIMTHICTEKNLNFEKYEFRNTAKLDEVLELDKTLGYYKVQELSLVSKSNRTVTGLMSSADMINVKSSKHRQNSVCDSSLSSGSFGSRSGSPVHVVTAPPQPPIRKKRRPAPKPPLFVEKEPVKKERNFSSVLISHSRESSDSSGYHEASVLSESPTHGGPVVGLGGGSPPDTLPRRSKLPSSQSFTNLTSIQPAPKGRLITSVSNTSLNSNGCSRKKRAPPPPRLPSFALASQTHDLRENKTKSLTLPISIAEEMRNGHGFGTGNSFASAKVDNEDDDDEEEEEDDDDEEGDDDNDVPGDASDAKVQIPVEMTSRIVNETKASVNESESVKDVDIKVPPRPKPRTVVVFRRQPETTAWGNPSAAVVVKRSSPNRRSCLDNLKEEEGCEADDDYDGGSKIVQPLVAPLVVPRCKKSDGRGRGTCEEVVSPCSFDAVDQADEDSINWEYQLPPPPTDFRDTHSPNCTEFGTITITPEVLERVEPAKKATEPDTNWETKKSTVKSYLFKADKLTGTESGDSQNGRRIILNDSGLDSEHEANHRQVKRTPQKRMDVMNELTNILNIGNRKQKEKSLSVSNLYINEEPVTETKEGIVKRSNQLKYSRSFSKEPMTYLSHLNVVKDRYHPRELENNRKSHGGVVEGRLSDDEDSRNEEITYRNYKNLEKSTSLECINAKRSDHYPVIGRGIVCNGDGEEDEEEEGVFRKPVAPVQKKLKAARRSASSIGTNSRRRSQENGCQTFDGESWTDDPSITVLRQQFLEFLKEKKLMNEDLKMKSLDVICNMLPEVVNGKANHVGGTDCQSSDTTTTATTGDSETKTVPKEATHPKTSQQPAQETKGKTSEEDKVKIVDVKVKIPAPVSHVTGKTIVTSSAPRLEKMADNWTQHRTEKSVEKPQPGQNNSQVSEEVMIRREKPTPKPESGKRYSYQGPPSINFGTWGERPKTTTKIIIKDEDYVTRDKVTEKKAENRIENGLPVVTTARTTTATKTSLPSWTEDKRQETKIENRLSMPVTTTTTTTKNAITVQEKPKEVKKSQIIIKKPGVLSHYEMFSALPKRKEIASLKFFMEEEERKRAEQEEKVNDLNRTVPVVCGIELKKEFKQTESSPAKSLTSYTSLPTVNSHSVSVYVNGNRGEEKDKMAVNSNGFILPKRNPGLMPVVKGFRAIEEPAQKSPVAAANAQTVFLAHEDWKPSAFRYPQQQQQPPPPPPPSITSIKLKSNGFEPCRLKMANAASVDPRSQLLDEIRNFGGLRKLKKSTAY